MENNKEIQDLDRHLEPMLDKKVKRGSFLMFINDYCDYIESIPLLMAIVKKGEKVSSNQTKKLLELTSNIKQDVDIFEDKLTKTLQQKKLFDINNPKYKNIINIKEIRTVFLREPPYDFSGLEASMLYAILIERENWQERHGQLRSAILALIEDNQNEILQELFPNKNTSNYKELISPSYETYRRLRSKDRNIWTIWEEIENNRPYFGTHAVNQLRELVLSLNYLIKIGYHDLLILSGESEITPLPKDVREPEITSTSYTLKFDGGEKIEFLDKETPVCTYFDLAYKMRGQIIKHTKACNELGLRIGPKSRKVIRGYVSYLNSEFRKKGLIERIKISTKPGYYGYLLELNPKKQDNN